MKYYVCRFYTQISATGALEDKTATYIHEDRTQALKQYYKFLSSDIDDETKPTVLVLVLTEDGGVVVRQKFEKEVDRQMPDMVEE